MAAIDLSHGAMASLASQLSDTCLRCGKGLSLWVLWTQLASLAKRSSIVLIVEED